MVLGHLGSAPKHTGTNDKPLCIAGRWGVLGHTVVSLARGHGSQRGHRAVLYTPSSSVVDMSSILRGTSRTSYASCDSAARLSRDRSHRRSHLFRSRDPARFCHWMLDGRRDCASHRSLCIVPRVHRREKRMQARPAVDAWWAPWLAVVQGVMMWLKRESQRDVGSRREEHHGGRLSGMAKRLFIRST